MPFPLTVTHLLRRAAKYFPTTEIVSRRPDKSLSRMTYGDVARRAGQLARVLDRLEVPEGARVATLCWNHNQHLECYLGVPASGRVVHTLNLRLHPTEIGYIARHAGDSVLVVDKSLLPLFEKFRAEVPSITKVLVVPDAGPVDTSKGDLDYEAELAKEPGTHRFEELDENRAAMICYTSGTTGNPKGVVYSHRSTVLHAMASCFADTLGIRESDAVLPVVPMFHAAAWGIPFAATLVGATQVFPGPHLDPESLLDLMAGERVTFAAGVPTIWIGILASLDKEPSRWDLSRVRTMVIGGAAAPPSMIQGFAERHRLEVTHAWGMTETNPLGTVARENRKSLGRSPEKRLSQRASQGVAVPFVETRHIGEDGEELPWDGKTMGELEVRGPWVAASYVDDEGPDRFTSDGWFKTGDVVTIDPEGYVRITDRSKDVVKSGGEWISSVALENALMAHPSLLEAAVFAGRHEKWGERPIAAIVLREGREVTDEELTAHLAKSFAKYWLPDAYVRLPIIPRTSTGKFLKTKLREEYGDLLAK